MTFRNLRNSFWLTTLLACLLLQSPRLHVEGRTMQTRETPTTAAPDIEELTTQSPERTTANANLLITTKTAKKAADVLQTTHPTTTAESVTEATTVMGLDEHINLETER